MPIYHVTDKGVVTPKGSYWHVDLHRYIGRQVQLVPAMMGDHAHVFDTVTHRLICKALPMPQGGKRHAS